MTIKVQRLSSSQRDFSSRLNTLLAFESASDDALNDAVAAIVAAVAKRGDAAVLEYTERFDGVKASSVGGLQVSPERLEEAYLNLPAARRNALEGAAQRIRQYHQKQLQTSWSYEEADGTVLGQQITPLERVGLYVPGGKAAYPSSVLMNAIPAKVAGVDELIMVTPAPGGEINPMVLAAAHIAEVDQVFTIGGAQAIAALAYGTATVAPVDKIVGPGNAYVAAAKRQVFGRVGIDMVAGPSEILIICDGKTDPLWITMDLFSQAEHDEVAQAILISPDADFLNAVEACIARELPQMPRREIIAASLANRGALIEVKSLDEAITIANQIAPEHLELSLDEPRVWAKKIKHAGAIFLGRLTAEGLGDYCAGPNHVLPTSRTARFSSPLGVYDFQKRSSLIEVSAQGAKTLGKMAGELADSEGLFAHAQSARLRFAK